MCPDAVELRVSPQALQVFPTSSVPHPASFLHTRSSFRMGPLSLSLCPLFGVVFVPCHFRSLVGFVPPRRSA